MKRNYLRLLAALLPALYTIPVFPQPDMLNSKSRAEIVHRIGQLLVDHYVFPDTALSMRDRIESRLKHGAYDTIIHPVQFSDRLLNDLYSVYHDGHMLVQYNPVFAAQLADTSRPAGQDSAENMRRLREINFGFHKVEILNGNIGYIDLRSFHADRKYGLQTMKAALGFVANTHAIIIDVRNNGGGSQETATLLMGFFLDKATHVESFYNRYENTTTEYWTEPDSSFPGLRTMPLYILTSNKSFSCAEMFPYDLQALKRATVVGEVTGGGAHGTFEADASNGFVLHIPYWRGINPITGTNWEHTGVRPDIEVAAGQALETAELEIFQSMLAAAKTPREIFDLRWQIDLLKAVNHPVVIDTAVLRRYAGVYGERVLSLENGKLFYQRKGRPKWELEAMSPTMMKGKDNNYFKIEFVANELGEVNTINTYYQDDRMESAARTE